VYTYIFLCYAYCPLMDLVSSIHGTLLLWVDQLPSLINCFFFEQLSMSYIGEIWFPNREQSTQYVKQHLFGVSKQHIPLFLSIMFNWSVKGNLTLREFTKCRHDRHCQKNLWFLEIGSQSGIISVKSVQAETKHALQRAVKWVEPLTCI
jgi:hypothetical protein